MDEKVLLILLFIWHASLKSNNQMAPRSVGALQTSNSFSIKCWVLLVYKKNIAQIPFLDSILNVVFDMCRSRSGLMRYIFTTYWICGLFGNLKLQLNLRRKFISKGMINILVRRQILMEWKTQNKPISCWHSFCHFMWSKIMSHWNIFALQSIIHWWRHYLY